MIGKAIWGSCLTVDSVAWEQDNASDTIHTVTETQACHLTQLSCTTMSMFLLWLGALSVYCDRLSPSASFVSAFRVGVPRWRSAFRTQ